MNEVKHVKRKSDGVIIDVPAGHWSTTSDEYEVVEIKSASKSKSAPRKSATPSKKA